MAIDVHDTITGTTVAVEDAPVASEVVERTITALGLPRRSETGDPLVYELYADGQPIGPDDPRTATTIELRSHSAGDVYVKAKATLDEIESELDGPDDEPKFHLTTRLAFIRRTGAFPNRVTAIEKELSERVFSFTAPVGEERPTRTRLYVALGFVAFVAIFGTLFWVTRPTDRPLEASGVQEGDLVEGETIDPDQLPIEINGEIAQLREIDSYLLDLGEGDSVRISLRATGGNLRGGQLDTELTVNNPSGSQAAYNDDVAGSLNSGVVFVASETGTYDIRAAALGGCCVGTYVLSIEVDTPEG